jgi:uncharacterized protein YecE (DUF72 family)
MADTNSLVTRQSPAGRLRCSMSASESLLYVRVGTASWSEPEFVKAGWYPPGLPAGGRLSFYAERFDMVELNSSFYAIPAARMCERWARETPPGFLFDVKCHRLLSRHATKADALPKDLRESADLTDRGNVILTPALEEEVAGRFLESLDPLEQAGKLGALLLQMTPSFAPGAGNLSQLEGLLSQLKGRSDTPRRGGLAHHGQGDRRRRNHQRRPDIHDSACGSGSSLLKAHEETRAGSGMI